MGARRTTSADEDWCRDPETLIGSARELGYHLIWPGRPPSGVGTPGGGQRPGAAGWTGSVGHAYQVADGPVPVGLLGQSLDGRGTLSGSSQGITWPSADRRQGSADVSCRPALVEAGQDCDLNPGCPDQAGITPHHERRQTARTHFGPGQ